MLQKVHLEGDLKIGQYALAMLEDGSHLHDNSLNGMWGWKPGGGELRQATDSFFKVFWGFGVLWVR